MAVAPDTIWAAMMRAALLIIVCVIVVAVGLLLFGYALSAVRAGV